MGRAIRISVHVSTWLVTSTTQSMTLSRRIPSEKRCVRGCRPRVRPMMISGDLDTAVQSRETVDRDYDGNWFYALRSPLPTPVENPQRNTRAPPVDIGTMAFDEMLQNARRCELTPDQSLEPIVSPVLERVEMSSMVGAMGASDPRSGMLDDPWFEPACVYSKRPA